MGRVVVAGIVLGLLGGMLGGGVPGDATVGVPDARAAGEDDSRGSAHPFTAGRSLGLLLEAHFGLGLWGAELQESSEGQRLSIRVTARGRGLLAELPGASGIYWQRLSAAWPEPTAPAGMRQQWDCHVLGGWLDQDGSWDLETWRGDNPDWITRIPENLATPSAVCNW